MDYCGWQIFLIHPNEVVRNRLVYDLRHLEFEAFGLEKPDETELRGRRESILLVAPSEEIQNLDEITARLELKGRFLHVLSLGHVVESDRVDGVIEASPGKLLDQIVAYLENNDARGLRHFVRFGSQNASIAMFNFVQNEHRYAGVIHDISSGGISCTFKPEPEHLEHLPVTRMNVSLPTGMVSLSGRFTADRMVSGQPVHIFEFDPEPAEEAKKHIYNFIYASLETKLSLH